MDAATRTAVTDEAIAQIGDMVVSGRLAPGERLPREHLLAADLGLSRNSLREAVRALTMVNVLESRQGDGTYVTSLDPALLTEGMGLALDVFQHHRRAEVFELRRVLESAAAGLAAARATCDEIVEMRALAEALWPTDTLDDALGADLALHRRIGEASGNAVLSALVGSVTARAFGAGTWDDANVNRDWLVAAREDHLSIVEAMDRRDPELARASMLRHLEHAERWAQLADDRIAGV
jgi:DNA-binding FadR family transcriptional regulator